MSNWQAAEEGDIQDDFDFELEDKDKIEKDSILFVIDCGSNMFEPNEHLKYLDSNTFTAFQAAMKCVASTMKNKIISSESDRIGVICYNTGKSKNPAGFPHIFYLQELDIPDAPSILEIEKFSNKPEVFKEKFSSSDAEFPFGNVFWTIANIFSDKKFIGCQKRVFLFTCEDTPNGKSESLQRAAKTRGRDLIDLGISLELFALPKPVGSSIYKQFNYKQFYSSIISDLEEEEENQDQLSKFEELLSSVRRRETRKRALARTEMSLGPSMNLSVKLYSLYMETKKGQYIWQNEKSGKLVTPKTEWICKKTGKLLQQSNFKFSFDYGGNKIIFTREEMGKMYKFDDEIGLKVLGFKPHSVLKTSHNVTHSSFVYPDETIIGSVATFACLLKNCLELDKLLLCRWTARRGAPPRLVALLPQAEKVDEIGTQIKAPGFNMIVLPFADDIRHLKFNENENETVKNVASHDQIDKAKALITKLALPAFNLDSYDNPVLQSHYANLQALALDQEIEGELEDCTLPAYDRIKLRAQQEISDFVQSIGLKDVLTTDPPKDKTTSKRFKPSSASEDFDPISAISAVKNDPSELAKFTVNDLKNYLDSIGIKAKRVKTEIIQQISNQ